ncbi:MAG: tRNA dihydrouridine synthase DusB [Chlamydiae bacterium]|nr:tRNA dihydrouridine synthase DusB [Chlamydiota bacterium]
MNSNTALKLGDLILPNNILYAPLAGFTDLAFRRIAKQFKPGLMFCEMVKIEALIRGIDNTLDMLEYDEDMHPIGAQICGSNPKLSKECAKIIEDKGFDIIDFNCGCPVNKVIKDGSGSAMLKTPELIGEILSEIISGVKIPVSVKVRIGWDFNSINILDIVQIAEKAGAAAITIHGRTRSQGYSGPSNWEYIKESKKIAKKIKVIGNGGLFEPLDIEKMFKETNCDGVMVARGALQKPWIAKEWESYCLNKQEGFFIDKKALFLEHLHYTQMICHERQVLLEMKKIAASYLKNLKDIKHLRIAIMNSSSTEDVFSAVNNFNWA